MICRSAEEAIQEAEAEGWDNPEEAVHPGKSCMPEFEQILDFICEFSDDNVFMVFRGYDTYITRHNGEYVADFEEVVDIWSMKDVVDYIHSARSRTYS